MGRGESGATTRDEPRDCDDDDDQWRIQKVVAGDDSLSYREGKSSLSSLFCHSLPRSGPFKYHIRDLSYQGFLVRPLLREPRPQVHYKSRPDAKAQRETQKSTNVKSLTKIE